MESDTILLPKIKYKILKDNVSLIERVFATKVEIVDSGQHLQNVGHHSNLETDYIDTQPNTTTVRLSAMPDRGSVIKTRNYIESLIVSTEAKGKMLGFTNHQELYEDLMRQKDNIMRDTQAYLNFCPSNYSLYIAGKVDCINNATDLIDALRTKFSDSSGMDSSSDRNSVRTDYKDSCYGSEQDLNLDRYTVDSLNTDIASDSASSPNSPHAHQSSPDPQATESSSSTDTVVGDETPGLVPKTVPRTDNSKLEKFVKMGYTEDQYRTVLSKLGLGASYDTILSELISLGKKNVLEEDDPISYISGTSNEGALQSTDDLVSSISSLQVLNMDDHEESSNLHHIVIDGSNVAMSHGNKEVFSCKGIKIVVDWFKERGHTHITVFVPQWRKEAPRSVNPITDQDILLQLEKEKILTFTPSRRVAGKRIVCYDDRYILKLASCVDGIIVSNDNYRDLIGEKPEYKKIVEERLLMFTFVDDRFMPPEDPLGRHGPSLPNFLRKEPLVQEPSRPVCPYGKKCTYGNKCKYFHPERLQPQRSIIEQLSEHQQKENAKIQDRKETGKKPVPRPRLARASSEITNHGQTGPPLPPKSHEITPEQKLSKEIASKNNNDVLDKYRNKIKVLEEKANQASNYVDTQTETYPTMQSENAGIVVSRHTSYTGTNLLKPSLDDGGGHLSVARKLSNEDEERSSTRLRSRGSPSIEEAPPRPPKSVELMRAQGHKKLHRQMSETGSKMVDIGKVQSYLSNDGSLLSTDGSLSSLQSSIPYQYDNAAIASGVNPSHLNNSVDMHGENKKRYLESRGALPYLEPELQGITSWPQDDGYYARPPRMQGYRYGTPFSPSHMPPQPRNMGGYVDQGHSVPYPGQYSGRQQSYPYRYQPYHAAEESYGLPHQSYMHQQQPSGFYTPPPQPVYQQPPVMPLQPMAHQPPLAPRLPQQQVMHQHPMQPQQLMSPQHQYAPYSPAYSVQQQRDGSSSSQSLPSQQMRDQSRQNLFFHLCGIFPTSKNIIQRVLLDHPEETDAKTICAYIIAYEQYGKM